MDRSSGYIVLFILMLIPFSHAASNTISNTTLIIVGLPAGAKIPVRFAPNYTTVTYTATGYTTNIPVYISASTNSTYSGKVPYQWQGAGTTVTYNGVTYTMLPNTYTQLLNVGKNNILGFYVYLNSTLWNTNETAELKAANSSLANAKLMIARIQNSTAPIQYGNSKAMASGNYLKLGQKAKYADIISNSTTGANITFYTSNVIPNNTYLNEKVSNSIFNQAGNYTIGLSNNNGNVVVDGSLASSLVLSNKVNYTYEIKDMVNGTILANGYADAANTINIPFNYKIKVPKNDSLSNPIKLVSITFDAAGNGNYSSVDPTTYVIGTWTSQNNLINGFDAGSCVNYQNYIYCINGNDTKTVEAAPITNNVIGTWTSQNSLEFFNVEGSCVNYQNYIYCADGGSPTGTNTVEAAPITNNVIGTWTVQNSLINSFQGGSCVNYQNYIYCTDGNGANTVEAAPITNNVIGTWTVQNSLINNFKYGSCVNYQNYIYCADGSVFGANTVEAAPITNNVIGTWTSQNNLINDMGGGSCVTYQNYIYCANGYPNENTVEAAPITNNVIGTWTSQNSLINNFNQGSCVNYQNYIYCANGYPTYNTVEAAPINEVIPYTPPTITISNNALTLDQGQSITFNGVITGGTAPYTVNVFVANAITPSKYMLVNTITTSGTTWSNTITTNSLFPSNSPLEANVVLTDSHPTTVTSGYTSNFIVNPALTTPLINPSNPTIDNGQSVTFTSTWSGGTTDYTAKLYSSTTSTCNTGSTPVQTLLSLTSGSASFSSLSPTSTTYYCIFITDSASTPETTNSINSKVVVNSALSIPTLSSSPSLPSTQASGNTITFTSSWSGGTSTYTANYIITNTITNDLVANMLFTGITTTSNSFAWTIPSVDIGNTVEANVIITDSASTPETANSVESNTLTIVSPYTAPTINSFSCPSQSSIYSGGSVTCTVSINNGESPYTYNWLVVNSITKSVVSNELFTNIASTTNTLTFTTQDTSDSPFQFNVIITDSHPTTINSIYSSKLEVVSVPSITPTSPTNIISGSTLSIIASNILGGTSPYTYNFNVFNSISGDIVGNYLISGITSNSYTFNFITTNEMAGNFLNANVIVTDAASVTTNSINSAIIHVENYPTVTISPSSTFTEGTSGASLTTSGNPSSDYLKAYISGQLVASGTVSLFVSLTGYTVAYYSANVEDTNTGLWTNTTFDVASSSSGGGGGGGGSLPKSVSVIVPVINKTLNITTIPTQQTVCLSGGVLVPILGTLNNFYSTTISAGILAVPIWIIVAAILLAMSGYLYVKSNKSSSYVMVLLVFLGALYVILPVISAC